MQKLILGIIGSIFLFIGCANKDLAKHYTQHGEFEKAYNIYKKWYDIGYVEYAINLVKLENNETKKIKLAEDLYNKNISYGANILENIYYNRGNFRKARYWYKRADLIHSTQNDFYVHLKVILTFPTIYSQKRELEKIEKIAENNVYAAYALGKFYEDKNNYFYNLKKSIYFYKKAYEKNYIPAGINLAKIYLYKLNNEKKGVKLLEEIASREPKAAYILVKYYVNKLDEKIIKLNTPCITCSFKKPYDFFYKKYYLIKYKDAFIKENIIPLAKFLSKRGYKNEAKILLIRLDLKYNNFEKNKTYSGFTLNEAINFLKNISEESFEAKLLLADIYYRYSFLNKYTIAKKIYLQYANVDKINGYWHLYQYYKKYEPNSPKKLYYLNYLVRNKFMPALIEKAYLNKNLNALYRFYKKADNYQIKILALKYYVSLKLKQTNSYFKKCVLYKKLCIYTPFDKTIDFKIAKLYEKQGNYVKAATIYKFYSEFNDPIAYYKLSLIYKNLCSFDKYVYYLKKAEENGDERMKLLYASKVVKGEINDDAQKYFEYIKDLADKNNIFALSIIGDLYATGIYVNFDPNKAQEYYLKAIHLGDYKEIYSLIDLYKKINLKHKYDNKIIKLYKLAIKYHVPNASVNLAEFYISNLEYNKAIRILKNNLKDPKARYLLYRLTGKDYYLNFNSSKKGINTNYGRLLLAYAKKIGRTNPYEALFYSFRASLCNTGGAVMYSYEMMKRINDPIIIRKIYERAKKYPKCKNY